MYTSTYSFGLRLHVHIFLWTSSACPHIPLDFVCNSHNVHVHIFVQPIADRVAQNLKIISTHFHFGTRRTRILMGFVLSTMLLRVTNRKSHGQNSGSLT